MTRAWILASAFSDYPRDVVERLNGREGMDKILKVEKL